MFIFIDFSPVDEMQFEKNTCAVWGEFEFLIELKWRKRSMNENYRATILNLIYAVQSKFHNFPCEECGFVRNFKSKS